MRSARSRASSRAARWPVVALVCGGVALGLAAGEIGARWLLAAAPPAAAPRPAPQGLREISGVFELAAPGVEGIHQGVYFRTNSAGFRGPEYARQPRPGVLRIAAVGDSFVMGEGVLEEEAYPAVLEHLLNQPPTARRVEVLNFGVSGANIHHVIDRLEGLALSFHPHLILYGLTSNDIEVDGYRTTIDAETIQRQRHLYGWFADSPSRLLRLLWPRWVSFRTGLDPPRGTYLYEVIDNYLNNPQVWANFVAGFDRLAAIGRERGIPVVVFIHPIIAYTRAFHPFDEVYDRVRAAVEERGLIAVEGFPAVAGRQTEALWISPANPHPNAVAHRYMAETLAEGMRRVPALSGGSPG